MAARMDIIGVIPARYNAVRLRGKPLIKINGIPLIQWTFANASRASLLTRLIVATDDRRIFHTVQRFGGQAILTSSNCQSGTDRVAEVAAKIKGDIFVNIQGDEPLLHPSVINGLVRIMIKRKNIHMATAGYPIKHIRDLKDPHTVKVVVDRKANAHYFSRSAIPCPRDQQLLRTGLKRRYFLKHLGVYAYRRDFLRKFMKLPQSVPERLEKLEQLRALDSGYKIQVIRARYDSPGIDVYEDIKNVEKILKQGSSAS
ncbi:MAG: 3-deoxy-manno-octulosonate cytidylyltransferase [Elusimicrobia bacterium]|nr:3-deoxy-manno-octulosonate cytidylyltransferase [Elusimicrobiota bacterium]MBD3411621.1 3-deoxy-manno-octulosonate cytidylyltransferase [Elusimicrobiota bacterium]